MFTNLTGLLYKRDKRTHFYDSAVFMKGALFLYCAGDSKDIAVKLDSSLLLGRNVFIPDTKFHLVKQDISAGSYIDTKYNTLHTHQ